MSKLFSWFGDKNKQESGGGKKSVERAVAALQEASEAAAAGNSKLSTRLHEESIGIYRSLGMKPEEAAGHHALARMLVSESAYTPAFEEFDTAIDLYRSLSVKAELAEVLRDAGQASAEYSNFEQATEQLEESLWLFKEIDDKHGIAATLLGLGRASHHDEDFERARSYYQQSLDLYNDLGLHPHSAECLVCLSTIAVDEEDFDTALKLYLESIERYRSANSNSQLTTTLAELGEAPFAARAEHQVLELLNAALSVYTAAGKQDALVQDAPSSTSWQAEVSACLTLAPVAYSQMRPEIASNLLDRAVAVSRTHSDSVILLRTLYQAAGTAYGHDDRAAARQWYDLLTTESKAVGDAAFEALALFGKAELAYYDRNIESAMEDCQASLELFKSSGNVGRTARALTLFGMLLHESGDTETGIKVLKESLALCRREEDAIGVASALLGIGEAGREVNPSLARESLQECLDLDDVTDGQTAATLQRLAELELSSGELATAYELSCKALPIRVEQGANGAVADSLECCAHVAVEWGDIETAVILLSRAESLRTSAGSTRKAAIKERFDSNVDVLKAEMGDTDFVKSWSEGSEMSLEEIVEEALSLMDDIEPEEELLEI